MDLKNQMTADKSDSRLLVRINYGTASEVVKINDEIIKWINSNMGPYKTDGLAGIPVMFSYLNQENSIGLMTGLAFSFAFIVILVGFALRSLKYGLISIIPNIVPFILGFGIIGALTSGMIQGPHQTSVLISIGLVVDATIHFLTKYKKAIALGLSPQDSIQYCFKYVGYPIIIASICLFIGFLFLTQSIFISNYIIGGMCETDFSGYPDCRNETINSMEKSLNLGMDVEFKIQTPLMFKSKAEIWELIYKKGDKELIDIIIEESHTCYKGDRSKRYDWGYGCNSCPACELRSKGWNEFIINYPELKN